MSGIVDREFCRENAPTLGLSPLSLEEAFLGEDRDEAARIMQWIKGEEVRLRKKHGRKYAWRTWSPRRMLRNWAVKESRGAFRQNTNEEVL